MTSQANTLPRPFPLLPAALLLALAFTAMRAVAMFGPVYLRPLFLFHCVLMAATPWLLLSKSGRIEAGLCRAASSSGYAIAAAFGIAAASACHLIGYGLFGAGADNWFVSVGASYRSQPLPGLTMLQLHLLFTIPAVLFSPFGEEIFFRGVLQRALENRFSERIATLIESMWFGAAHLIHHGIVLSAAGVTVLWQSAPLWLLLMTGLSFGFAWLRKRYGSVLPAVAAHAAFNATMNSFIFAYLW